MLINMANDGEERSMHSTNDFDVGVAIAAATYLIKRMPRTIGMHGLAKLLYFADREHLSRYGRFIVGDHYIKMEYGPVPSRIYDGVKAAAAPSDQTRRVFVGAALADAFQGALRVSPDHKRIQAVAEPDMDELSESDVECLDWALDRFSGSSFGQLTEVSHGPAWTAAERHREIDMIAIAEENNASEEVLRHLADPHPG